MVYKTRSYLSRKGKIKTYKEKQVSEYYIIDWLAPKYLTRFWRMHLLRIGILKFLRLKK